MEPEEQEPDEPIETQLLKAMHDLYGPQKVGDLLSKRKLLLQLLMAFLHCLSYFPLGLGKVRHFFFLPSSEVQGLQLLSLR